MNKSIKPHIEQAIRLKGSQAKLAADMGCSQQQISYLLSARNITAEMAIRLEEATGGTVSRHTLRPDLFGPPTQAEGAA